MKSYFANFLLILNFGLSSESVEKYSNSSNQDQKATIWLEIRNNDYPEQKNAGSGKWISQLFTEGERKFEMKNVNENCAKDFGSFRAHLYDNQSIWSVRLLESSEWPSVGILAGVTHHLGHYSECLRVDAGKFKGQYCLVESIVKFELNDTHGLQITDRFSGMSDDRTAWQLMKKYEDHLIYMPRNEIYWAMCIPSSCSHADLQMSLASVLNPLFEENNLSISINVNSRNCQTNKKNVEYPASYTYTKNFILILLIFVIVASVVDFLWHWRYKGKDTNYGWRIPLRSYSVKNTFNDLVHYSPLNAQISICTIKTAIMFSAIAHHRGMFSPMFALFYSEEWENNESKYSLEGVDLFFTISGFLMYYNGFKPMKKMGLRFFVSYIVLKYISLVTSLTLFLSFSMNILPYVGNGPLWPSFVNSKFGSCHSVWWKYLLLVNNVQAPTKECYITAWHVAAYFQLSILGIIILLIITKNRKYGMSALVAVFLLSTALICYKTYSMNAVPYFITSLRLIRKDHFPRTDKTNFYFLSYGRINNYLLGFITGMLVQTLNERNYKFSLLQVIVTILWFYTTFIAIHSYGLSAIRKESLSILDLAFAGLFKVVLYLPCAILLCIFCVGHEPPRNKLFANIVERLKTIFTWKGFVLLNRLSFGAGLANSLYLVYHLGIQPNTGTLTGLRDMYYFSLFDIVVCYSVAFISYLLCEGPVSLLSRELKRQIYKIQF